MSTDPDAIPADPVQALRDLLATHFGWDVTVKFSGTESRMCKPDAFTNAIADPDNRPTVIAALVALGVLEPEAWFSGDGVWPWRDGKGDELWYRINGPGPVGAIPLYRVVEP